MPASSCTKPRPQPLLLVQVKEAIRAYSADKQLQPLAVAVGQALGNHEQATRLTCRFGRFVPRSERNTFHRIVQVRMRAAVHLDWQTGTRSFVHEAFANLQRHNAAMRANIVECECSATLLGKSMPVVRRTCWLGCMDLIFSEASRRACAHGQLRLAGSAERQ